MTDSDSSLIFMAEANRLWVQCGPPSIERAARLDDRIVRSIYVNRHEWWVGAIQPKPRRFFVSEEEDIDLPLQLRTLPHDEIWIAAEVVSVALRRAQERDFKV